MSYDANAFLSPHFRAKEFFDPNNYTDVINPETGRKYTPEQAAALAQTLPIDKNLLSYLENFRAFIREKYSDSAVILITPHGGYRPDELNIAVGGATNSQHRYGKAADIMVRFSDGKYLDSASLGIWAEYAMAKLKTLGGIGVYTADGRHIHVDVRGYKTAWYATFSSAGCPGHGGVKCIYRKDTKGAGVVWIQRFLKLPADGFYGASTKVAVAQWQSQHGLDADGVFGPMTNTAMNLFDWR